MKYASKVALVTLAFLGAGALLSSGAVGDDDEYEHHYRMPWGQSARPGVAPVEFPLYREECGSCHMAYPPGLLPAVSWEKIMAGLDRHFGENAELGNEERIAILNYLLDRAAGRADYRLSNRMIAGMGQVPMRITELPYFRHEHREIPPWVVRNNPGVRSFSQCNACHPRAERGIFDEHEVRIPGYGRFDDD